MPRADERAISTRRGPHWPAILTIIRIVLVVPVVLLTLNRTNASSWLAFAAFAIAALTDGLDGFAARKMGLVSTAGQLWDPIADKILVLVSMAALVVVGRFPAWAAAIIVVREAAVTVLRVAAERRGRGFPASPAGKLKTGSQLIAVLLFILPEGTVPGWIEDAALWSAVVLSLVSGLDYFRRAPALLSGRAS
ncbi:MAG TPA: CDP-diacylglycerol--glycerol-3-phosphate 3-phosphatidyltransferase [Actinomycetota bacterium]|nr:CDP-diacylglycerol--glycerol-3-phosphate 3-phosphatidyltransferase [Actinomycetota bacterium]